MPTFAFSGRTRGGEIISGERLGDTVESVTAALRREQIMVTRIGAVPAKPAAPPKKARAKTVNAKNLAVFTRQFSVMIDAGLPLVQCLDILGNQEDDKNFSAVILATRTDVEGGASLADAMRRHPKTFDALFTNMIAAGEAGGILDTILKRLATYIEKAVKLKAQVKSAMIYPVAIIVIAVAVVTVILWKVIPTFASLFAGLGAELPLLTRIVIALSNLLVHVHAVHHRRRHRAGLRLPAVLRHRAGPAGGRRDRAEAAGARHHHAQDRRRPLLPHAVDADDLGRADPRRARDHRQDRRQRHHRGRAVRDPAGHRARRDGGRRRSSRPASSPAWSCR